MPLSKVNGPGARFVVWTQGCSRHCPGCFNQATHSFEAGYELSMEQILKRIPYNDVKGITISGGEPFEQVEELAYLLEAAKETGLHRLVYTGFTYEELAEMNDFNVRKCLLLTDMLIDGPYQQHNTPTAPWTGSGNQRIILLNNGNMEIYHDFERKGDMEILIDKNGTVEITGIVDSVLIKEVL
jgi:anaerobic ribonucleoside-triphosphate reductase activating protein